MGIKALLKKSKFTYEVAAWLRTVPYGIYKGWMIASHAVKGVEKNKVYFSSFSGKAYNDNPRYICEALHAICPEAKLVFRLDKAAIAEHAYPDYVQPVAQYSPKALMHMATARVIVKNARFKPYMTKFKDQYYIQTWHGDRGFKRIALDLEPERTDKYIDRRYMDLGVVGSDYARDYNMHRAFRFDGELLECGCPRCDILIERPEATAKRVRKELGLPEGTKVLLYAPTFRDKNNGSAAKANFSLARVREALEKSTGEKWSVLLRGHSNNHGASGDEGIDTSNYPELSELMLACDMLITDYSSVAGDFFLLDRPVILYHADREKFTETDRGMIYDPEKSPFVIAHSEDELLEKVCAFGDAKANCDALCAFFGVRESGAAAMRTAERIKEILK